MTAILLRFCLVITFLYINFVEQFLLVNDISRFLLCLSYNIIPSPAEHIQEAALF